MKISELKQLIKEEYSSASKLYQIDGILVINTKVAFHKQIMSNIRAITGITIVKDKIYEPSGSTGSRGYALLNVKIDPAPFMKSGGLNEESVSKIVQDIKNVRGVITFKPKTNLKRVEL